MRYLKNDRLYCFSPPVMIATFLIEIIGALYVVFRYKMTAVTRLAAALLTGLAIFQLAEYNVCEGAWGVSSLSWARIGYVAITLLPPLGLHLATKIANQPRPKLVAGAYGAAAIFAVFFMFIGHGMQSEQCLGNYVIFTTARWAVLPYAAYYYGLLVLTAGYCMSVYKMVKKPHIQKALFWLTAGYAAFVIPTTAVNVVDHATIAGIPSIMCGFAVILAVLLVLEVLPSYHKGNERISSYLRREAAR
jgi:hypothetical protein